MRESPGIEQLCTGLASKLQPLFDDNGGENVRTENILSELIQLIQAYPEMNQPRMLSDFALSNLSGSSRLLTLPNATETSQQSWFIENAGALSRPYALLASAVSSDAETTVIWSSGGNIDLLSESERSSVICISGKPQIQLLGMSEGAKTMSPGDMFVTRSPTSLNIVASEPVLLAWVQVRPRNPALDSLYQRRAGTSWVLQDSEDHKKVLRISGNQDLTVVLPALGSLQDREYRELFDWMKIRRSPFSARDMTSSVCTSVPAIKVAALLAGLAKQGVLVGSISPTLARETGSRERFKPRARDVYVTTYPKSGTTWMQMICVQLLHNRGFEFNHIYEASPYLEMENRFIGAERINRLPDTRIIKTHLLPNELPDTGGEKFVYVIRNGIDVAYSYFHHRVDFDGFCGSFESFFEKFLQGATPPSSWFDHVSEWWSIRNQRNVLFLFYEDLIRDFRASLFNLAEFLGVRLDSDRADRIVELCSFSSMKENDSRFDHGNGLAWLQHQDQSRMRKSAFIREGSVGTGMAALAQAQIDRFRSYGSQVLPEELKASLCVAPPPSKERI